VKGRVILKGIEGMDREIDPENANHRRHPTKKVVTACDYNPLDIVGAEGGT
jgi:hypothetical protein